MKCPKCGCASAVTETRDAAYGMRRRRQCTEAICLHRFTTAEIVTDVSNRPSRMLLVDAADVAAIGKLADRMRGAKP